MEGLGLDQLKMLVASVDEGSFSAAARRLNRTQPAVSEAIAQLEHQLGIRLFDRTGRYPRLTREGAAIMQDARGTLAAVDSMRARARGLSTGLEVELSAALDFFLPMADLTAALSAFAARFPGTPIRLFNEALGAVTVPVMDGRASFGILGSLPTPPTNVLQERVGEVAFIWVAARAHPLAGEARRLTREKVEKHIQIVLGDRSDASGDAKFGVLSPLTWMVTDIHVKLAILLAGLGWGGVPLHMVEEHLSKGRLVELAIEKWTPERLMLPLTAIYRPDTPPGPAARWFLDCLKQRLRHPAAPDDESST